MLPEINIIRSSDVGEIGDDESIVFYGTKLGGVEWITSEICGKWELTASLQLPDMAPVLVHRTYANLDALTADCPVFAGLHLLVNAPARFTA